jgi:RNA methyltransferase, TrmH family
MRKRRMRPGNPSASLVVRPLVGDISPDLFHSLLERGSRDRSGLFIAEGFRALHAAVRYGAPVAGLAVCKELLHSADARFLVRGLVDLGCPIVRLNKGVFTGLAHASEPQGVLLALRQNWQPLPQKVSKRDLWLGVENIRTPGNLGTLLRSAQAAGATGLMVFGPPRDRADPWDPGCVRASMGSLFALKVIQTSHQSFRKWHGRYEMRVLGADGEATTDYRKVSFRKPTLVMLGEERKGLSEAQRATCDAFVKIPMCHGVDSLNIAMAGTLLVYQAMGQRGA